MKLRLSQKHDAAMTLFEVGIIIAVVLIMAVFLLQTISQRRSLARPYAAKARQIACINNLKQVGLAYRIWEGDNGDIPPMGISVTNGGSLELVATGNVVSTFLAMSNELGTPRILFCPADTNRLMKMNFGGLANANISYLVGADMTNDTNPQMILSGDSDWELGGKLLKPGLVSLATNDPVAWSAIRHVKIGSIGLADGSVQTTTSGSLHTYLQLTGFATNRFAIP